MPFPSITMIVSCIFFVYIAHSMYVLSTLFLTLKCSGQPCFTSYLSTTPQLQLVLFTSTQSNPTNIEVTNIATINNFTYTEELERYVMSWNVSPVRSLLWFVVCLSIKGTLRFPFPRKHDKTAHCSCMSFWLVTTGHLSGNIYNEMGQLSSRGFSWQNMLSRKRRHSIYSETVWVFHCAILGYRDLITSCTSYRRLNRRLRRIRKKLCRLRSQCLTSSQKYSSICLRMKYQCLKLTFRRNWQDLSGIQIVC